MIASPLGIETKGIGIEIEEINGIIAIGMGSMMIAGIDGIEVDPDKRTEGITTILIRSEILRINPNFSPHKSPCPSKSLCPQSLANEDNAASVNVPALL